MMFSNKPAFFFLLLLSLVSCKEDNLLKTSVKTLGQLPPEINESSGLVYHDQQLWTHNDSGDSPTLYQLSPENRSLQRTIFLKNALHSDWEDIAQDDAYFYIGDFGNNNGDRQDLKIYRIAKADLSQDTLEAAVIAFSFSDQTDFSTRPKAHNFDCEALVATTNFLYLFSKNHLNHQTRRYQLSKSPGTQTAKFIDSFDAQGLVTGAAWDKETQTLCLLGYTKPDDYQGFIWIFNSFTGNDFFSGQSEKVDLGLDTQIEGIGFWEEQKYYFSSEGRNRGEQQLYLFDVGEWLK